MKNSIAKDAAKLTASKVVTLIFSLVSTMMIARFRTLSEFGIFSQIWLITNLYTTLFMLGLPNSINYFLARAKTSEEKQRFISVYFTIVNLMSVLIGVIIMVTYPLVFAYFKNPMLVNFIYVMVTLPWAIFIKSSIVNMLIVYGKMNYLVVTQTAYSIVQFLFILIFGLMKLDFKQYMLGYLLIEIAYALVGYFLIIKIAGKFKFTIDKSMLYSIMKFSIPIGLATVAGTIGIEMDKLIIGHYMSVEQMAIYTNSARELPIAFITTSIIAVLLPHVAQKIGDNKMGEALSLWGHGAILAFIMVCFFSIGLFVYAPAVINILYSNKYLTGISVFRIYCLLMITRFTYFGLILNSTGKTKIILYSSIISLVLDVILNYVMFFWLGMIGPALSTLLTTVLVAGFQIFATTKLVGVKLSSILPWGKLGLILLINVGLGAVFFLIKEGIPLDSLVGNSAESVILGLVWMGCYALIIKKEAIHSWKMLK